MISKRYTLYAIRYTLSRRRRERGFTLIEIVGALGLATFVLVAVLRLQNETLSFNRTFSEQIRARTDARRVMETMVDELRIAATSETGTYPILLAQDNAITFYADVDSDGVVERIRYVVAGTTLQRGLLEPTGMPFIYDDMNEVVRPVLENVVTTDPLFEYFDRNFQGGEAIPPTGPDSIDLRFRTTTGSGTEEVRVDDVILECDMAQVLNESFGSAGTTTVNGWTENEGASDDAQIQTAAPLGGSPTVGYLTLEEDADVVRNVNTVGCTIITLRYYWGGDNDAESGEYLYAEWREGGTMTWEEAARHDADPTGCGSGSCPWSGEEVIELVGAAAGTAVADIRHIQIRLEADRDPNKAPQPAIVESAVTLRNLKDNL